MRLDGVREQAQRQPLQPDELVQPDQQRRPWHADHQVAQARKAGFTIDEVIADQGQSGVSTILSERPEGRRLFDKLRRGDTLNVVFPDPVPAGTRWLR